MKVRATPNTWTLTGSMSAGRNEPTATLLNDGRVLVVGGDPNPSSAELYDPATGDWSTTGGLNQGRYRHAAVLLTDGRVLVVGGNGSLASAEIYDPNAGTWASADSLNTGRENPTATLLRDGRVLVVGGYGGGTLASAEVYDPVTDAWTNTAALNAPRYLHVATLLPDGRVLVTGGRGAHWGLSLASAEVYDPVDDAWTAVAGMNATRRDHTATLLPDGRILVAGGHDGSGYLATAELYNPTADAWTTTGSMAYSRQDHTATLLPDGQVLVAGGDSAGPLPITEVYDPAAGTFSTTASNLNHSRYNHVATLLPDGRVLIAGGYSGSWLSSAELYDHTPTTPTWRYGQTMPTDRVEFAGALLADGRVLVAGGYWGLTYHADARVYDPSSADWTITGGMTISRTRHTMTLLQDGRVLVAGGYNPDDGYLANAELYDPETGLFTATGSMAAARHRHTATLLPNGRVLAVGGHNATDGYLSSAEIYDPRTGTWTAADSLAIIRGMHTATLLPNGQVMVAGGWSGSTFRNQIERYDPASDTWSTVAYLATSRRHHTATLLPNGKVLVAGGSGSTGQLDSVEIYDPATDTLDSGGTLNTPRTEHAALLLSNGRVLVAGGNTTGGSATTSVEVYDPTTDAWDTVDALNYPRSGFLAALLLDGQVLVASSSYGPNHTNTSELYDPVLTHTAWQTTDNLNAARYDHAATLLADGRVLLSGGTGATPFMTSVELYDPATGTFTTTGNLSAGRLAHTSTRLDDDQVLVAGGLGSGSSYLASAELYSPATGAFLPTAGNLGTGRYQHTATRLPDGQVLIAGGYGGSGRLASAELYSPTLGTFSATGSLNAARYDHTATSLPDGSVLVAGGSGGTGYLAQSERYAPATGAFTDTTGSMATGRIEHTATALPDGRVLVAGGRDGGATPLTSVELYDPGTDTWSTTGSMNVARYNHAAALLPDGRVLVAGGYNNASTYLDSAEVYDPATESWTVVDSMSNAPMGHTATALADGRVLVAGGTDGSTLDSAELYVEGRPFLDDATSPLRVGDPLTATGATFRYRSEASGGSTRSAATNAPLVQLMRLGNEQLRWLPVDATAPFSDTAFTSLPVEDWPAGHARATVFVNGIPSRSRMVQLLPALGEVTGVDPAPNSHTAPITTSLTMTLTGVLDAGSVNSQTVTVHGGFQGRMHGAFSFGSVVFDPAADFLPGELVQTTVTTDVIANGQPLGKSFVWQFRTATTGEPGVFARSSDTMENNIGYDVALGDVDNDGDIDAFFAVYHIFAGSSYRGNRVWLNDGAGNFDNSGQVLGTGMSRGVALGDLDGDGDLDAYVTNEGHNRVWVNQGGDQGGTLGTFAAGQSMGTLVYYDVSLGDVDGDGDLDALVAADGTQASQIWLNDGSATFSQAQGLSAGVATRGVSLGDLDNDGDLDAVLANAGADQHVYLNDGSGLFAAHPISPTFSGDPSYEIELGDLDGDSDLDAFLVNQSVTISDTIWLNDGTGGFNLHQELEAHYSRGIALGDLDADGDLDGWIANYWVGLDGSGPSAVWLNDGSATFTKSQETETTDCLNVRMGDVDGDGDLDAVVAHGGNRRVWLNLVPGQVTDVAPAPNTHTAPLTTTLTITIDAAIDTGSVTTETVTVYGGFQGRMDGAFSFDSIVFDPAADFVPGELVHTTVTTGVIAGGLPLSQTHVWQFRTTVESGRGWFVDSGQALGSSNGRMAELGDLDGDGDLDAFVSNYDQANTAWLNDGGGSYHQVWTDTVSGGSWPFGVTLGDLDGDGDLDVYEAAMWSNDRVLMNDGDGTFSHHQNIGSSDGRGVELADLDGDGDLDAFVATASNSNPPNRVYLNDGTGTLVAGQAMSNRRSFDVALGDLDDDGDLDAFVANIGYDTPPEAPNRVWLNNGDGTFVDTGQALGFAESQSVALGDLDGDGDLDAFVANRDSEPNTVWLNDGAGTFTDSGQTLGTQTSQHVALGDVDGDGDLDALVANAGGPNQVWVNDGSGAFSTSGQEVSADSKGISLGDVDGDGDLDAFITEGAADQVWFNQNTADLAISKTVSPLAVAPAQTVTYTLVYTNNGPEAASGVVITDRVPVTLTNVHYDATPPVTPTGALSFTWDVNRLDAGEGGVITVTGVVSTGVTGVFSLTNEAVITSALVFDGDLDNNRSIISATVDAVLPEILLTSPSAGAVDVALSAPVVITFSEAIDPGSLAYAVAPDPGGWAETWSGAGTAITLTHADFAGETVYTVTVTAADDLLGNGLVGAPVAWSFTTVDGAAPEVLAVSPAADAVNVALTAPLVITFSEAIDAGSLVYTVSPDPGGWAEAWNGDDTTVTLTHADFAGETVYTVTVTAANDLLGNPLLDVPYEWRFTTTPYTLYLPIVTKDT